MTTQPDDTRATAAQRIDLTRETLDRVWEDLGHPNHMIASLRLREDTTIIKPILLAARAWLDSEEEPKVERAEEPGRWLYEHIPWNTCEVPAGQWSDAEQWERDAWAKVERELLDRHHSRPEPPPAAPVPSSVQGEGKPGPGVADVAALHEMAANQGVVRELRCAVSDAQRFQREAEQERDRLRHSMNEQQVEIARLREDISTMNDARNGEHAIAERLREELRDERERLAQAVKELRKLAEVDAEALGGCSYVAAGIREILRVLQSPTASAAESEEKCKRCGGWGHYREEPTSASPMLRCPDCKGTGKTPTVESGTEVAPVHPTLEERGGLCNCKTDLSAVEIADGAWSSCRHCAALAHRLCHAVLDDPQHRAMTNWCEARPGSHRVHVRMKPVPQATAAEQPTPLTNERALTHESVIEFGRLLDSVDAFEWWAIHDFGVVRFVRQHGRALLAAAERELEERDLAADLARELEKPARVITELREAILRRRQQRQERLTGEHDARERKA